MNSIPWNYLKAAMKCVGNCKVNISYFPQRTCTSSYHCCKGERARLDSLWSAVALLGVTVTFRRESSDYFTW